MVGDDSDGESSEASATGTHPEALSDALLVRELIAGSEDALTNLYQRHGSALFDAAWRATRDHWIAAEVVQDSLLKLWARPASFDPARGSLRGWLQTVARNRAIDRLRAAARHNTATFSSVRNSQADEHAVVESLIESGQPVAVATAEPDPAAVLARSETRASLSEALKTLTPAERLVIILAYESGLSQSEVAANLGWPLGTVKSRTRRALRRLRSRLEPTEAHDVALRIRPDRAGEQRPAVCAPSTLLASGPPANCATASGVCVLGN